MVKSPVATPGFSVAADRASMPSCSTCCAHTSASTWRTLISLARMPLARCGNFFQLLRCRFRRHKRSAGRYSKRPPRLINACLILSGSVSKLRIFGSGLWNSTSSGENMPVRNSALACCLPSLSAPKQLQQPAAHQRIVQQRIFQPVAFARNVQQYGQPVVQLVAADHHQRLLGSFDLGALPGNRAVGVAQQRTAPPDRGVAHRPACRCRIPCLSLLSSSMTRSWSPCSGLHWRRRAIPRTAHGTAGSAG